MIKKILNKNLNLLRHYGVLGTLRLYIKWAAWYLQHTLSGKSSKYKKVKVNNYWMYINLKDSGISKALFIYGTRENDQMYMVENNLKRGMDVLDIGANIGYYVIFESRIIGPEGRIIAYEPSADNCTLLKKNIELNDLLERVEINNAAVSDKPGISRFYLSDKSNLHTLNPDYYRSGTKIIQKDKFINVETVDIYDILKEHKSIKFIRMDIEGHEVEVLGGIAKAVKDLGIYPSVLFETHFTKYDLAQHDITAKLKDLFKLGYFPKIVASNDERSSKLRQRYKPAVILGTDRVDRGIYEGISKEDALDFIGNIGGIRAVLLKRG